MLRRAFLSVLGLAPVAAAVPAVVGPAQDPCDRLIPGRYTEDILASGAISFEDGWTIGDGWTVPDKFYVSLHTAMPQDKPPPPERTFAKCEFPNNLVRLI